MFEMEHVRDMTGIDVAVPAGARLGESPVWSPEEDVLYWIDIEGRRVHRFDPVTGVNETRSIPGRPGSLVRTTQPGLLLMAMENQIIWLDWTTGATAPWLTLEPSGIGNRLNDGKTDPSGRYWVGSMHERPAARRYTGSLYRIEGDGSFTATRNRIGISNALAFDAERKRMYFSDTFTRRVVCFDYDLDTGANHNETTFVEFDDLPGSPDGACVDTEGCYWVAAVHGGALLRFTPDGRLDRRIDLPVTRPTMPAFGGTGLDKLFVTSIGGDGHTTHPHRPEAGDLLVLDPGVTGLPDPPFAGRPPDGIA